MQKLVIISMFVAICVTDQCTGCTRFYSQVTGQIYEVGCNDSTGKPSENAALGLTVPAGQTGQKCEWQKCEPGKIPIYLEDVLPKDRQRRDTRDSSQVGQTVPTISASTMYLCIPEHAVSAVKFAKNAIDKIQKLGNFLKNFSGQNQATSETFMQQFFGLTN